MQYPQILITFFLLVTIFSSCKKEVVVTGCFGDVTTTRQIVNKRASVKLTATVNPVWIIEQGSIDNILIPCNFPMEFYQDDLQVTISGEVKSAVIGAPCCVEDFVITKISR